MTTDCYAQRPGDQLRRIGGRLPSAPRRHLVLAAQAGDEGARERLIDAFLPLIGGVARRYRNVRSVERGELLQEGVVGLLRALERYDVALGTPFWAYASYWVRQAMQDLVAQVSRPVVLSDRALRHLARVKDARTAFVQEHSKEPSVAELAEATGLPRDQIETLLAVDRGAFALEEQMGGDGGGSLTLGDLLADPRAEDDFDGVTRRAEIEAMRACPVALTRRERDVLLARFGFRGPEETLKEVGSRLGVSAERVRQIEKGALDKMRAAVVGAGAA
jgi:RNA polymerase sigma factor (sigma-70 family)